MDQNRKNRKPEQNHWKLDNRAKKPTQKTTEENLRKKTQQPMKETSANETLCGPRKWTSPTGSAAGGK